MNREGIFFYIYCMKNKIILLFAGSFLFLACSENEVPHEVKNNDTTVVALDSTKSAIDTIVYDENPIEYNTYGEWHEYIANNFDSTSLAIIGYDSSYYDGYTICSFAQNFEKGISYSYGGCGEGGETEHITFPGYTKEQLYTLINTHFFIEDNTWNKDSTEYEADGAGCYYSIKIENDTASIHTYCGC